MRQPHHRAGGQCDRHQIRCFHQSPIAADFTEEYDFTSIPQFTIPTARSQVGNGVDAIRAADIRHIEENKERNPGDESIEAQILPNFLKGSGGLD